MTKYIYKGEEISHTRFITICQMAGIMGGRKKSHYQKLVEMAEQGNDKAADILSNLEVKKVFESINLDIEEVADFIEEQGLSFVCNDKMQVEASDGDFVKLIERFPQLDYVEL